MFSPKHERKHLIGFLWWWYGIKPPSMELLVFLQPITGIVCQSVCNFTQSAQACIMSKYPLFVFQMCINHIATASSSNYQTTTNWEWSTFNSCYWNNYCETIYWPYNSYLGFHKNYFMQQIYICVCVFVYVNIRCQKSRACWNIFRCSISIPCNTLKVDYLIICIICDTDSVNKLTLQMYTLQKYK